MNDHLLMLGFAFYITKYTQVLLLPRTQHIQSKFNVYLLLLNVSRTYYSATIYRRYANCSLFGTRDMISSSSLSPR